MPRVAIRKAGHRQCGGMHGSKIKYSRATIAIQEGVDHMVAGRIEFLGSSCISTPARGVRARAPSLLERPNSIKAHNTLNSSELRRREAMREALRAFRPIRLLYASTSTLYTHWPHSPLTKERAVYLNSEHRNRKG